MNFFLEIDYWIFYSRHGYSINKVQLKQISKVIIVLISVHVQNVLVNGFISKFLFTKGWVFCFSEHIDKN